ncbi:MAG: hypothetical protein IPP15_07155 [Saprospiraceae bacterium]|uniref:Uncharacterized protein n=1 Tax=Candidatus Opimibacter skivensis TaxID=2982028 RepID=A0A9D7SU97_9BACT|nr:hypothetical protein [Candidatus Opimibacter skivensis]
MIAPTGYPCPHDTLIDCGFYNNPDALGYPTGTDNCTPSGDLILNYHDDLSGLTGCTNTGVILGHGPWKMHVGISVHVFNLLL